MRRVFLESPYAGDVEFNTKYAAIARAIASREEKLNSRAIYYTRRREF